MDLVHKHGVQRQLTTTLPSSSPAPASTRLLLPSPSRRQQQKALLTPCSMERFIPTAYISTSLFVSFLFYLLLTPAAVAGQANITCPLNFTVLDKFSDLAKASASSQAVRCQVTLSAIHLVQADYLRSAAGLFLPPLTSADACWLALQPWLGRLYGGFDPRRDCGFKTAWISRGCMNISSRADFERTVPSAALATARSRCAENLQNGAPCAACNTALNSVKAGYLSGRDFEGNNVTDCTSFTAIYAAGIINPFGPSDLGTADCLFSLQASGNTSSPSLNGRGKHRVPPWIYAVIAAAVLAAIAGAAWIVVRRLGKRKSKEAAGVTKTASHLRPDGTRPGLDLESVVGQQHTTLVRYTLDEIKAATANFSRDNIIGKGAYGNVYGGVLPGAGEVAVKRFKNSSASGDADFAHELEVIASVRHVNLVALRGYCIATTSHEGHQRIIVCDLVRNGSLHDYLFGGDGGSEGGRRRRRLSWSERKKIAVGMARGLCYLHCGVQPGIIHRDVKASNILLDDGFEAKVADFGLAKFTPEGASHVSTRVAGTLGYVAPEYALYGKLTEKSDVYSFGIVLLELLSGKKAVESSGDDRTSLVADWAWELVRQGKAMDVVEQDMEELGPEEVVERFVLVAVLCSHPLLHARPTMDQALKMLEADMPVPVVPDRPISIMSDADAVERSLGSDGSGQLHSLSGSIVSDVDK